MPKEPLNLRPLNIALARALGVSNPADCLGVTLIVKPGEFPQVTATFILRSDDGVAEMVDAWQLVPQRQPGTEPLFAPVGAPPVASAQRADGG